MTAASTSVAPRRESAIGRWASLGGIAYVVLFIVGTILAFQGTPDSDSPPLTIIAYYRDSGHRDKIASGWVVVMLGVFAFLWFLARLRDVVARYEGGFLPWLVLVGGTLYAAATTVAISVWAAIATMSDDTFRHQVYYDLIHAAGDAGYLIHAAGGAGAGAMIIAASLVALRSRRLPAWAGWVGVALGIIGLFSILFFPQLAIAIWVVAASIVLFMESPTTARA